MHMYPTAHPMIPWDHRTFHRMSNCPSLRCVCVPQTIPSHDPMGPWYIPRDIQLSLSQVLVYPTAHPMIPWDHRTFHRMSTCPYCRCMCVPLSIPSHGTIGHSMGCPPVPLIDACVSHCPSHPTIPWDHRTFHRMCTCLSLRCVYVQQFIPSHNPMGHSTGCPTVLLSDMCVAQTIPSHSPMGPWDIPRDVQLSLSQLRVYPTAHPTVPWDLGTFHGMSNCPSLSCVCIPRPSHDPMGP